MPIPESLNGDVIFQLVPTADIGARNVPVRASLFNDQGAPIGSPGAPVDINGAIAAYLNAPGTALYDVNGKILVNRLPSLTTTYVAVDVLLNSDGTVKTIKIKDGIDAHLGGVASGLLNADGTVKLAKISSAINSHLGANAAGLLDANGRILNSRLDPALLSQIGSSKLPIVNFVEKFGAPTNGTTNICNKITEARDYIQAIGGGIVYIPPGSYRWDGTAELGADNILWYAYDALFTTTTGATGVGTSTGTYAFGAVHNQVGRAAGYGAGARNWKWHGGTFKGTFNPDGVITKCAFALHHLDGYEIKDVTTLEMQGRGHSFADLNACRDGDIIRPRMIGFRPNNYGSQTGTERSEAINLDTSDNGALSSGEPSGTGYSGLPTVDLRVHDLQCLPLVTNYGGTTQTWPAPNPIGSHGSREGSYFEDIHVYGGDILDPVEDLTTDAYRGVFHFNSIKGLKILGTKIKQTTQRISRVVTIVTATNGTRATSDPNVYPPPSTGTYTVPNNCEDIEIDIEVDGFQPAEGKTPQAAIAIVGQATGVIKKVRVGSKIKNGYTSATAPGDLALFISRADDVVVSSETVIENYNRAWQISDCTNVQVDAESNDIQSTSARPAQLSNVVGVSGAPKFKRLRREPLLSAVRAGELRPRITEMLTAATAGALDVNGTVANPISDFNLVRPYITFDGDVQHVRGISIYGDGVGDLDVINPRIRSATKPVSDTHTGAGIVRVMATRTGASPIGVGEIIIDSDSYGVARDGVTDDTLALDAMFAAADAAVRSASVFGATVVIYLRGGRYIDSKSRVFANRITIRGDGPQQTILYRKTGASGDYLTLNSSYSGIEDLTIDANRSGVTTGDAVVLNAYRTYVQNSVIVKAAGNGITIGKASGALGHRLSGLGIGQCAGYGILVVAASSSTDGMWSNIDIGQCGLSGFRISNGGQNLSNVHCWGCGLESTTDNHGAWLDSASNVLSVYQGETNNGSGLYVSGSGSGSNQIIGPKLWANIASGLRIFSAAHGAVVGGEIYRNGGGNTGGTGSVSYAGIHNDAGVDWTFTGVHCWEDSGAVGAGDYSSFGTAPTYPFPGRASGVFYQTYAYAEANAADYNVLAGCKMRRDQEKTGSVLLVGNNDSFTDGGNDFGTMTAPTRTVTSGAVRAPAESDVIVIATNAAISSVLGGRLGRLVTLIFTAASPGAITSATTTGTANSILLAGRTSYTPVQNSSLTLRFDGTQWWESGRS